MLFDFSYYKDLKLMVKHLVIKHMYDQYILKPPIFHLKQLIIAQYANYD